MTGVAGEPGGPGGSAAPGATGPGAPGGTGPVRVGFFSFTEVTDPAAHRSYNEWHQLDHLPEQYPIPGVAWGQRWVSTPACRQARAVEADRLAAAHYMTLYLMTDPVPETLAAFAALGRHLREVGRFHEQRRALLSGPFDAVDAAAAPRVLVSPAAVPFRPGTGVYVTVHALADGADPALLRSPADRSLLEIPGVAGVWCFAAAPDLPGAAVSRWRPGAHRVTVCYLDGEPLAVATTMAGSVASGPAGSALVPVFAGPLETVVPWQWDWFD